MEIIEEELWKLMQRGLDGVWVFHTLYHRQVTPLAERVRPMWKYSGVLDPDRVSLEELLDHEVWSRLGWVLQLKPREKVEGKPIPLNASVVSRLVCSSFFTSCSYPPLFSCFFYLESPIV